MNRTSIIGNLGADPEISETKTLSKYARFSIAYDEKYKNNAGEVVRTTDWHKVVVFNDHFTDLASKYLKKGTQVLIEGKLKNRKHSNDDGTETQITEIIIDQYNGAIQILNQPADKTISN